jgi:hypothetical protein
LDNVSIKALSKPTRLDKPFSRCLRYRRCDGAAREELEFKAQRIVMLSTQPITILREALQYLENQRVMAPGYRFLQDLVSRVATGERCRITDMLGQAMTPGDRAAIGGVAAGRRRHVPDQRAQT